MDRAKAKKVVFSVLLLALVAVILSLMRTGGEKPLPSPPREELPPVPTPVKKVSVEEVRAYLKDIRGKGYRNPFLSQKEREWRSFRELLGALPRLSGVLMVGGEKVAILDGAPVKEGERIRGFSLVRIEEKGVRLRRGRREYFLSVKGGSDVP